MSDGTELPEDFIGRRSRESSRNKKGKPGVSDFTKKIVEWIALPLGVPTSLVSLYAAAAGLGLRPEQLPTLLALSIALTLGLILGLLIWRQRDTLFGSFSQTLLRSAAAIASSVLTFIITTLFFTPDVK
ncbi:MAG: hypothetical protein SF029_25510 [bacterium]|nr:hypothetical protein [bacterium]